VTEKIQISTILAISLFKDAIQRLRDVITASAAFVTFQTGTIMWHGGIVALFHNLPNQEISRICNSFPRISNPFLRD